VAAPRQYTQSTRIRPIKVEAGRARLERRTSFPSHPNWGIDKSSGTVNWKTAGTQYTESEGHPFLSNKDKNEDLGGDFFTQKRFLVNNIKNVERTSVVKFGSPPDDSVTVYTRRTPELAIDPNFALLDTSLNNYSNDAVLDMLGTTAISRVKPTNPVASLTQALVELKRDGLPYLPGSQSWERQGSAARNAGDEYLNVQFGWQPLINDITAFGHGVVNARSVIDQYKRNIGRPIRRTYHFPTDRSVSERRLDSRPPFCMENMTSEWTETGATWGSCYCHSETVRERWFSGCFTYFFPSEIFASKKLADLAILARQLGLEISPDNLWKVAPWSWAVGWFSNMGDVISNWSAFHEDGLVMRYGYMMERSITTNTYSLVGAIPVNGEYRPVSDVVVEVDTKLRRKATPYGFGLNWNGFSAFQSSILVALGLSRAA